MTTILGISAFYHDSAAALIVNGEIVSAAQEERFTRKKHDASFPQNRIYQTIKIFPPNNDIIFIISLLTIDKSSFSQDEITILTPPCFFVKLK